MTTPTPTPPTSTTPSSQRVTLVVSWLWVLVPFGWGVYELILKARSLFG